MSTWDGSPQASMFSPTPSGLDALFARIARLERSVRELTGANILSAADVLVSKEGLSIAGQLLVTGNMRIEGTLSLPAGIIDNDALANPVLPGLFRAGGVGFGTSGWTTVATSTVTVPAGFTKCVLSATGYYLVTNSSDANLFVSAQVVINGGAGDRSSKQVAAGTPVQDVATAETLLQSLTPGTSFTVSTQIYSPRALAAAPENAARISGTLLWFR